MKASLLATRYHIPPATSGRLKRSRLFTRLDELLLPGKRLGLVSALAGSGKTTLVRAWAEQLLIAGKNESAPTVSVAWFSMEEEDNDLATFLAYTGAALKVALPGIEMHLQPQVSQGSVYAAIPVRSILVDVLNQLAEIQELLILVFDDYHVISNTAIHDAMTFLLDHLPDRARAVIVTRAESLLPISRLRARGQLVEIREADLRFTTSESSAFLNDVMGLHLDPVDNELLLDRIEGWAAGLQMAALALRALPEKGLKTGEFVRSFSSSRRFMLDYLMDEIFLRLPSQTQSFLLQSAFLDRFCPDLIRAVIGENAAIESSLKFIEDQLSYIHRSHLFIIPLDDEGKWYRYYHLFADLLRNRMRQDDNPEKISKRQKRAATWFVENGFVQDAIHYLFLSHDYERAANLVESCAQEVISTGRLVTLSQWIAELPPAVLACRPRLRIFQALTSFLKGDSATAITILEDTELILEELTETDSTQSLKRELISILAISNITGRNSQRILPLIENTLETIPETELIPRARLLFARGMACAMASDRRYYTFMEQAIDLARKANNLYLAANILNMQAMGAVFFQAQYHTAWNLYASIIQICSPGGGETLPLPASLGYTGQAAIALEWNKLEQVADLLNKSLELSRRAGQSSPGFSALLVQARLKQARGDFEAAQADLEEAASDRAFDDNIAAVANLAQAQVRLHLATGHLDLAEECASGKGLPLSSRPGPGLPAIVEEVWNMLRARVLLAQGHPNEALAILDAVIAQAKNAGRMARVIEGNLVKTMGRFALQQDALEPLQAALAAGKPQGITRLFLEAGSCLCDILVAYRPRLGDLSGEADRLLHLMGEPVSSIPALPVEMVEPLTAREMDVLRLLCEGRSNREIAARLFLSLSAVKKYTGNLYGKLGVASRAQAIIKAHELKLN